MNNERKVKKRFDALIEEWKKAVQDPAVRMSSRPKDYTDNEAYREIVQMGEDALPFIIEKLEEGVFLLNQAALDIAGLRMDDLVKENRKFLGERQKSAAIVEWWKSQPEHRGKIIAVVGEREMKVVASGTHYNRVVAKAKKLGIKSFFIMFAPDQNVICTH